MSSQRWPVGRGPFRADQIRSGDPYELSRGHPIYRPPACALRAPRIGLGGAVLGSDPAVERAGVDTGIELAPDTLRAFDIAVSFTPGAGTWATGAPLVVDFAVSDQDDAYRCEKIEEFHAARTGQVWVVRLAGERRVEVHERARPMRTVGADGMLTAPGVLALPVPVRALYDRDAAHETTLRNLLSRQGHIGPDATPEAIDVASRRAVLLMLLDAAGVTTSDDDRARVAGCDDAAALDVWIRRARTATTRAEVFEG